jgi:hypothetical protein
MGGVVTTGGAQKNNDLPRKIWVEGPRFGASRGNGFSVLRQLVYRNSPACNLARDCNLGPEIAIWEPQPQPVCPCSSHTIPSSTSFSLKYLRKVLSFPSHLCSKECVSLKLTPPYGQTPTDEVKISKSQIAISAKFESEIAISAKLQSLV